MDKLLILSEFGGDKLTIKQKVKSQLNRFHKPCLH